MGGVSGSVARRKASGREALYVGEEEEEVSTSFGRGLREMISSTATLGGAIVVGSETLGTIAHGEMRASKG